MNFPLHFGCFHQLHKTVVYEHILLTTWAEMPDGSAPAAAVVPGQAWSSPRVFGWSWVRSAPCSPVLLPAHLPSLSARPFPCPTAAPSGLSVGYCPEIPKSVASSKACLPVLKPHASQSAADPGTPFPPPLFGVIVSEQVMVTCRERKATEVLSLWLPSFWGQKAVWQCDAGSVQSVN